jgi:hypothetical protein
MTKFKVTIVRTITTRVFIDALTAAEARKKVEDYGVIESAMDMSDNDEVVARISSVTQVDGV